ncbi:cAMP-binding domain of CRP or a regulatory subunit of cAMP-dependent protein kinases [Flavobacterium sp. 9AF]|uniref:Crp/Fnr family transcriptional regulator n=1 Tax=Flavobacterium sp. 9AF TaxID=2653142 RepID=UPI0012F44B8E|nr:cyclic nucleotide-binding domain-containing protein [Flavobacterium sp. 9AF]VXB47063.1 cAMP-binding domain of CRP or a regulatory subunit of cAMP-dependent protein kinases [Flavobacterium sp. 9AF]
MKDLLQILKNKTTISEEDWLFISSKLQQKQFKKKEFIIETHQIEDKIYFIQHGIFRLYIEMPEKDVTIDFGFPNNFLSSYSSFLTQTPSVACIQSLTKGKVIFITQKDLYEIYQKTKCGESIGRIFAEEFFRYKSKRELSFLKDSPTERYLNLVKEQPQLIQEIPQKYLASYIGITPQALSRIRGKI